MLKRIKTYLSLSAKHILRSGIFIKPYIDQVERCFQMTPEELNQYKEKKFLEIFRNAYDNSMFYHRMYTEAGISKDDINSLADISKLPIVTKEMVRNSSSQMLTVPVWKLIKQHTSGTTGTPLIVYEDWSSIWLEQAYHVCSRRRCGFSVGEPFVSLRGHLDKGLTNLYVHSSNTLYLSSYNINKENIERYYNLLLSHKPKAIEGYPSSLYNLALLLDSHHKSLNIPLAFTSSESLLPNQRVKIEQVFNTEIFDMYGMTERTVCLMESLNHDSYYEMPGYGILEIVDDGEVCTSLINKSFPLIRYKSTDVIEVCNNKIIGISGRNEDYIVCKDGTRIMSLGFVLKDAKNVKFSQIVQMEKGKIEIRIVPDVNYSIKDENLIRRKLDERIGASNIDLSFKTISDDQIIYTSNEKFKYIISAIN